MILLVLLIVLVVGVIVKAFGYRRAAGRPSKGSPGRSREAAGAGAGEKDCPGKAAPRNQGS